jgi:hypothetical protein
MAFDVNGGENDEDDDDDDDDDGGALEEKPLDVATQSQVCVS